MGENFTFQGVQNIVKFMLYFCKICHNIDYLWCAKHGFGEAPGFYIGDQELNQRLSHFRYCHTLTLIFTPDQNQPRMLADREDGYLQK